MCTLTIENRSFCFIVDVYKLMKISYSLVVLIKVMIFIEIIKIHKSFDESWKFIEYESVIFKASVIIKLNFFQLRKYKLTQVKKLPNIFWLILLYESQGLQLDLLF